MKVFLSVLATGLLILTALSFTKARHICSDILQQLSVTEEEAHDYIFSNFREGDLSFPVSSVIKSLIPGKRAAVVKELGDYIRQYTSSPAFLEQYKEAREAAKPQGPANKEEKIKARLAEIKHDIEEAEKGIKENTGDMKKLYELTLQQLKQEQKALQDPKDPYHATYTDGGMDNGNPEQYKRDMAYFEKEYPVNSKDLVKKRLKEFLDLTATIDFNAKLVESKGLTKFADPALEAKSSDWKRCFRSGKETITAARAYAAQWLKELGN
jgi:hypothetical protein